MCAANREQSALISAATLGTSAIDRALARQIVRITNTSPKHGVKRQTHCKQVAGKP